jgi:hypothetical protein
VVVVDHLKIVAKIVGAEMDVDVDAVKAFLFDPGVFVSSLSSSTFRKERLEKQTD